MAIKIDSDIKERVKRLAEARKRIAHWMVCEAVRQPAMDAWIQYRATGMYLTAAEADVWLAKLEAGEDVDPSECHA